MTSELTPTLDDDAPALAGAIVYHAGTVCETADHLWRVLSDVSIPTDGLTDNRQQHKVSFGTEPMARVYIYQTIYNLAQSEVADRLENRPALLKRLGLDKPPTQQNISYAWEQFSEQTKSTLDASATGIALEARDHGIISDVLVPTQPSDDDTEDKPTVPRAHVCEHGSNVVELARKHGFGEFDSNRAENRVYEDDAPATDDPDREHERGEPDLDGFETTFDVPGIGTVATSELGTDAERILDEEIPVYTACQFVDRGRDQDGKFTYTYDVFGDCAGRGTVNLNLVAIPPAANFVVVAQMQLVDDRDFEALDVFISTLQIN